MGDPSPEGGGHLEGAGLTSAIGEFEDMELVPIELAALRVVREAEGLAFPESDHPLLHTPLADIPSKPTYKPAGDDLLQSWLAAARRENRSLDV